MFRSFLIVSLRNLIRQKGFSLINLLGLTIALTVSFLILLYVLSELSYDKFHREYERIYRVAVKGNLGDMPINVAVTPGALGLNIKREMPEVENYTMFEHITGDQLFSTGDDKFYENHLIFADTNFFDIFNFDLVYGDINHALKGPNSIVLTRDLALKYFGNVNPVGKQLKLNNSKNLTITGVLGDIPEETHLPVKTLVSFESRIKEQEGRMLEDWGSLMYYTYVRLSENTRPEIFEDKLRSYLNTKMQDEFKNININIIPYLQRISDIHLNSNLLGELKPNSDKSYIYILILIAAGILFIAGINFMNLSTARSSHRAREVSIRKINGSGKHLLIRQFIGESVIYSLIAFVLSLAMIELLLPVFNRITLKELRVDYLSSFELLLLFMFISLLMGIFSGSYPAFYLSAFNPLTILQTKLRSGSSNTTLRNILVFFQFFISAGLIFSTLMIFIQLDFIRKKRLGFDSDNLIAVYLRNDEIQDGATYLKERVKGLSGVESASLASSIPGTTLNGSSFFPEGYENNPWLVYNFMVDQDFIPHTFRMGLIQGRNFDPSVPTDSNAVIINETLRRMLNWEDPLDKTFTDSDVPEESKKFKVIGVVSDFHFRSLHEEIEPTMLHFRMEDPGFLIIRLKSGNIQASIRDISALWNELNPELPFDFEFVNENFENLYSSEKKLSSLLTYLSLFAIFIATLGLLGLVSFTAEQRTKEIGIRKVMGASLLSISKMLSLDYLRLILLANILSFPVGTLFMRTWLQSFSYHSSIPAWLYPLTLLITLIPALLILNYQTLKTANTNPVNALRYE